MDETKNGYRSGKKRIHIKPPADIIVCRSFCCGTLKSVGEKELLCYSPRIFAIPTRIRKCNG